MTQTLASSNHTARALTLLGSGVSTEQTATALGVTPSAISQLLSNPEFAEEVAKLRYENLRSNNVRDEEYDSLEDRLLAKLNSSLGLIMRPEMILKAIQVVNAAKRRGQSAPQQISQSATVVSLIMPVKIMQKFTTNINNQVIQAGDQSLHTIDSSTLVKSLNTKPQLPNPVPGEESHEQQIEAVP